MRAQRLRGEVREDFARMEVRHLHFLESFHNVTDDGPRLLRQVREELR